MDKQKFLRFLLNHKVLTFGDFITKSGRNTPYFFNLGKLYTGKALKEIGEYYASALLENFGNGIDNLFGPAYKAIPLAVSTASAMADKHKLNLTYTFNRKEVKDHGEGGWLVGENYLSQKKDGKIQVLILEDVTTAGTSIREVLPGLRAIPSVEVVGLLVAMDRMEKGKGAKSAMTEIREEFQLKTASISDFNDVIEFVKQNEGTNEIPSGTWNRMQEYRLNYGA